MAELNVLVLGLDTLVNKMDDMRGTFEAIDDNAERKSLIEKEVDTAFKEYVTFIPFDPTDS